MPSVLSTIYSYLPGAAIILLPNVGGLIANSSAITTRRDWQWYDNLKKPWFNPPKWIFGPVWTVLYLCMGVSSYMIVKKGTPMLPLSIYGAHLLLNWAWSPIFFHLHRIDWALAEILLLWTSVVATAATFYSVDKTAAYLLLPYFGWVSFASFLTFTYWRLNGKGSQPAIKDN